jgi:multidrug resistance efflux pump
MSETPVVAKKSTKNRTVMIAIVLVVVVLGAIGIVLYYSYQGKHFVSTDDARVAAYEVTISPQIGGSVLSWEVTEGDVVQSAQVVGRLDLSVALTSGVLNPQTMGAVGGIVAEKALLKAPIAGQVIKSNAVVGQMASPGAVLAIIADTDHLYVSANIKEEDIRRVKIGMVADVRVDAVPDRVFSGRVGNIGRATASSFSFLPTQNESGNYTKVTQVIPIKIELVDATSAHLMMGMNAGVKIHIQ